MLRSWRNKQLYPGSGQRVILHQDHLEQRGLARYTQWVELRQLKGNDFYALEQLRLSDRNWLEPWEANSPPGTNRAPSLPEYIGEAAHHARKGTGLYFSILPEGHLAGQIILSDVRRGAALSANIGYWIHSRFAGRGITTLAVAMLIDWCFTEYGLHRIEINIRPENNASLRLAAKLGLHDEGLRRGLLYIAGQWADHRCFAITKEDWEPEMLFARLAAQGRG